MLKVIVRRFQTEAMGAAVVNCLKNMGFGIAEHFSPDSDSMGGLIETELMNDFDLSAQEAEVVERCRKVCRNCLVLWERYEIVEEGSSEEGSDSCDSEAEEVEN